MLALGVAVLPLTYLARLTEPSHPQHRVELPSTFWADARLQLHWQIAAIAFAIVECILHFLVL
jgi:hypothetical protein